MMSSRGLLFLLLLCFASFCVDSTDADFSQRYMYAVDKMFQGFLSSPSQQQHQLELNQWSLERREILSHIMQTRSIQNYALEAFLNFSSNNKTSPSYNCLIDLYHLQRYILFIFIKSGYAFIFSPKCHSKP